MISSRSVVRRAPGVRIDGGGRLAGVPGEVRLNDAASMVWERFDGSTSLAEVARDLGDLTGEPVTTIVGELTRLCTILLGAAAIEVVGPTPPVPAHVPAWVDEPTDPAAAVAAWVLGDGGPLHLVDPTDLLSACRREGVVGALWCAVADGVVLLPASDATALAAWGVDAAARSQALEGRLAEVAATLDERGIPFRVLKGVAVSRLDHPRWEARPMRDVDVLVPRPALVRAAAAVGALGARRRGVELRPGHDRQHGKAVTMVFGGGSEVVVEIDLHAALVAGPYGTWADPGPLFRSPGRPIRVRGRWVTGLSLAEAFVHACLTAVVAEWRVSTASLLDVAVLAAAAPDPDAVAALATAWRAVPVVERATWLAAMALPVAAGDLARLVPRRRSLSLLERAVERAELLPHRNHVVREALTVASLGGLAPRLRYARASLLPVRGAKGSLASRARRAPRRPA